MPIQENHHEPGGVTAPAPGPAAAIQEEKPRPPRAIRWLRYALLLSYLSFPIWMLAGTASGVHPGYLQVMFVVTVLPFMLLLSLIYLIVWLNTRRSYRFGSLWSTPVIVIMSALQLIVAALAASILYQLSTWNPYG